MLLLGAVFALFWELREARSHYTDSRPAALPRSELPPRARAELLKRVEAFQTALQAGQPVSPLELTATELNGLIEAEPEGEPLRDRIHVRIEDGKLGGEVSLPLDELGVSFLRGRYLNGAATFHISLDQGFLDVRVVDFKVKGKPLPTPIMAKVRAFNLARKINQEPQASIALDHLRGIKVAEGKLVLVPKDSP